ncbi:MAG: GspE/PulE family protein [Patescibacteria group bacterium]|nr:GspE/PulE family protein [Patescibacteria group bacterium]
MTLIQQLLKKGIIDKEQATSLEFEVKERKKKEEELLIEKKIVTEDLLFSLKSENLNIPLKTVDPEEVPLKTLELIPEETVKYYQMIPLSKKGNFLEVGMVYPEDLKAQEALKFLARQENFNFQVFLITFTTFNELLKQYHTLKRELSKALEELKVELKEERVSKTVAEFERLAEEAPITKIVAVMLRQAVDGGASDLHIEPGREKMRVRFRLLGQLHSSIFLPMRIHPAVIARVKILSNLKIDETRVPQDGRFSTKIDERDIDFRVSTFPTVLGEKVAIRVLDPTLGMKKFEELGLESRNFEVLKKAIKKPYGLILATGPTGCGKTTTLYALLQALNKEGVNIVTLEDPVEYFIEGVNQSQIKPEINYDFARGLRHVLRQDPDIIMVGEIRDEETAFLVTHAALTGHIVLSTLHTNDALGGIPRLIDLGIKPFLISPMLNCIIAQRLVRRLCQFCKKETSPKREVKNLILKEIENLPEQIKKEVKIPSPMRIFEPTGCKKCNQEGFSGRIALFEILEMTDQLAEVILKAPTIENLQQEAKRQGMITMFQDGVLKVLAGVTTIEEVLKVAEEK